MRVLNLPVFYLPYIVTPSPLRKKRKSGFLTPSLNFNFFDSKTSQSPSFPYYFNLSEDKELCNAFKNNLDIHDRTASLIYNVPLDDVQPEMSAFEVMDKTINEIEKNTPDFICINFANPDMVGHTGNLKAAIKACETVDNCLGKIVEKALTKDYFILIIADHGNCETMINSDGSPNTAHTTNPVPIILVDSKKNKIKAGILSDIAPTILNLMNIDIPKSMNRKSLII